MIQSLRHYPIYPIWRSLTIDSPPILRLLLSQTHLIRRIIILTLNWQSKIKWTPVFSFPRLYGWELRSSGMWYRGANKSFARTRRKQANGFVKMTWISFGALYSRGKKKTWWQLASWCWNLARPWHAPELVSFLLGLRTYQHPSIWSLLTGSRYFEEKYRLHL